MRARWSCAFDVPAEISRSVRDLFVLVSLYVVQHEDLARAVRELREGSLEVHREIAARSPGAGSTSKISSPS